METVEDLEGVLKRFIVDNAELEKLESILDDFNPFVSVGWTRQELRHSAFLRWILDPKESHGQSDYFLKSFLRHVSSRAAGGDRFKSPSVFEVDSWSYGDAQVVAEWRRIDIFIRDDVNQLFVVIENKIDSKEHGTQLKDYRDLSLKEYPGYQALFVYLTPEGDVPSEDDYTALSYSEVVDLLSEMLHRRSDQIGNEVGLFVQQYVEMLKRHIVEDSEIQRLCRSIYATHKKALDVIFEYRPDRALEVNRHLLSLIEADPRLIADASSKYYIRFAAAELDFLPKVGKGWTKSERLLLFEFDQGSSGLRFKLIIGPGGEIERARLAQVVKSNPELFSRAKTTVSGQWWSVDSVLWISQKRYHEIELAELLDSLSEKFSKFMDDRFKLIVQAFSTLQSEDQDA